LIEVLTAAALSVAIGGITIAVVAHLAASWAQIDERREADATAREVLDRVELDLQSAALREDDRSWLAATILDRTDNSGRWETGAPQKPAGQTGGSLRLEGAAIEDLRFGQAGLWLRFFVSTSDPRARAAGGAAFSSPVAVGYQIVRRHFSTTSGEIPRYCLFRSQVRPAAEAERPGTFESGYDLGPPAADSNYANASPGTNDGRQPDDPIALRAPGALGSVLAENVIDFGVRFYSRDDDGQLVPSFPRSDDNLEYRVRPVGGDGQCVPAAAEIMVRVLTRSGARKISALESIAETKASRPRRYASDADWWWGVAATDSRVLTRRIALFTPK
jgi:hypothetical protein